MTRFAALLSVLVLAACMEDAGETGATEPTPTQMLAGDGSAGNQPTNSTPTNGTARADEPRDRDKAPTAPQACKPSGDCEGIPTLNNALKYPIVLAHGMGGFDEFWGLTYYMGVEKALRKAGYAVYTARVDPLNGSDVRGKQLAAYVERVFSCTCAQKVNLIGHSQGGIDARYVVDVLEYADRVASVTTIAAPHHGTPVADALLAMLPDAVDPLLDFFAWMVGGLYTESLQDPKTRAALTWCSTAFIKEFTEKYPPSKKVKWYSYAGRAGLFAKGTPECDGADLPNPKEKNMMHPAIAPAWAYLGGVSGVDNDGLVTVESARFGKFRGCIPADHLQEIGIFVAMWPVFEHKTFYREHAEFLAKEGH